MVASSSPPLFPQLEEMSDEEKYRVISRFIPCSSCSCQGFQPQETSTYCTCGHDTFAHVDNGQDLDRRLKVATRLNELLYVS
jgi:histone acetyltransferase